MKRIIQIATGHQPLKADFAGQSPLPILLWALVEDEENTQLVGMVMNPDTKEVIRADELDGFRGYSN